MGLEGRAVGPRPSEGRGWKAGSEGRNVEKMVSYALIPRNPDASPGSMLGSS